MLLVEAACLPGRGTLRVTGTVGPMTRESANVAMTWVRSHADRLAGAVRFDRYDGRCAQEPQQPDQSRRTQA